MIGLKDLKELHKSSVVANSLMNRERGLSGGNSYSKELSFDILDFLQQRLNEKNQVSWLDICCGSGKALIETARYFREQKNIKITGLDLAGMFDDFSPDLINLSLIETSFEDYQTESAGFDLITSVHGFHYIGDKLRAIKKSVYLLKPDGLLVANLDPANFKFQNKKPAGRKIIKYLRSTGLEYNARKHLLICRGQKLIDYDFEFCGADDQAGANYTGQAVVNSYYR